MLVIKHYFLTDFERIMTEREVRKIHSHLTDEEVYALDDRELVKLQEDPLTQMNNETQVI
jgi:hypothetical protein